MVELEIGNCRVKFFDASADQLDALVELIESAKETLEIEERASDDSSAVDVEELDARAFTQGGKEPVSPGLIHEPLDWVERDRLVCASSHQSGFYQNGIAVFERRQIC